MSAKDTQRATPGKNLPMPNSRSHFNPKMAMAHLKEVLAGPHTNLSVTRTLAPNIRAHLRNRATVNHMTKVTAISRSTSKMSVRVCMEGRVLRRGNKSLHMVRQSAHIQAILHICPSTSPKTGIVVQFTKPHLIPKTKACIRQLLYIVLIPQRLNILSHPIHRITTIPHRATTMSKLLLKLLQRIRLLTARLHRLVETPIDLPSVRKCLRDFTTIH